MRRTARDRAGAGGRRNTPGLRDGVTKRGRARSYVIGVEGPETAEGKPGWVSGFAVEDEAEAARDEARVSAQRGERSARRTLSSANAQRVSTERSACEYVDPRSRARWARWKVSESRARRRAARSPGRWSPRRRRWRGLQRFLRGSYAAIPPTARTAGPGPANAHDRDPRLEPDRDIGTYGFRDPIRSPRGARAA